MPATRPSVEIRNVTIRYGEVIAVSDVSLEVPPCSMTALVGESGCGKTSLLRAIAGFEVPSTGSVAIEGTLVSGPGVWIEPRNRHVGMVFQQGALFPHLNVWENVQFGLKGQAGRADRTADALRLVGLDGLEKRYPDELSGGQQQRVALARAIAPSPKIVLLDEPFGGLDASLRQRVRDDVCTILRDAKVTSILVTHDQQEALSVAELVAVMHSGRILQVDDPASIYHRPATLAVAMFVGEGQLISCMIERGKARHPFGVLDTDAPDGPAEVLIRPEELEALPAGEGMSGVPGRITFRRYFGHDALDDVRLDDVTTIRVRRTSVDSFSPGSVVRIRMRPGSYPVYGASGTLWTGRVTNDE